MTEMTANRGGAIAAGHPKTAEAGLEILKLGGNAFDAAIAAVLAACVAEHCLTSVAGGGFLLAHTSQNQNILFDFFTQTPRRQRDPQDINFYPVQVNFGTTLQEFHVGMGAIAVPGTIAGLWHVHQRLGRLPFEVIAEPAIHYARSGIDVEPFQAYCFQILSPILLGSAEMRHICAPQGDLLKPGELLVMSHLADTLTLLAAEGARGFYQGAIGQQLVKDCQEQGGYLTLEDLQQYQVIERVPLTTTYRGNTLLTNPPPSSGGSLIAFALQLLSHLDLATMGFGTVAHLTALAQVMRLTNLARKDGYDACLYEPDVAQRFLSPHHVQSYLDQVQSVPHKWGSTTHVSVIDRDGNAASATTSNGEGSAYVIPGTGVMVNNMLGEADLHPHGFHSWRANERISSMMAPTMLLRDGQVELALGSGGSNRIRTAILQVISNIVDFQMAVETAVNSPRIHWENGVLNLEPGFPEMAIDRTQFPFNQTLIQWEQQNMFFGGVHTVFADNQGGIAGAGDRRRSGAVAN